MECALKSGSTSGETEKQEGEKGMEVDYGKPQWKKREIKKGCADSGECDGGGKENGLGTERRED